MVIDDLNLDRPRRPLGPRAAHPPLVIDTEAVLTLAGALERFESVAGQVQIDKRNGRLQLVELHFRLALEPGEGLSPLSCSFPMICSGVYRFLLISLPPFDPLL
jgi:hypothetical protein